MFVSILLLMSIILLIPICYFINISMIGRELKNTNHKTELHFVLSTINSEIIDCIIEFIRDNTYDTNLELSEFMKINLLKKIELSEKIPLSNKIYIKNNIDIIVIFIENNLDLVLLNQL